MPAIEVELSENLYHKVGIAASEHLETTSEYLQKLYQNPFVKNLN